VLEISSIGHSAKTEITPNVQRVSGTPCRGVEFGPPPFFYARRENQRHVQEQQIAEGISVFRYFNISVGRDVQQMKRISEGWQLVVAAGTSDRKGPEDQQHPECNRLHYPKWILCYFLTCRKDLLLCFVLDLAAALEFRQNGCNHNTARPWILFLDKDL